MKKITIFLLTVTLLFSGIYGCMSYKRVTLSSPETFSNKKVKEGFGNYNVYLHDGNKTYKVEEPSINEDVISGIAVAIGNEEEINTIRSTNKVKGKNDRKYDLNIYTKSSLYSSADSLKNQPYVLEGNGLTFTDSAGFNKFELNVKDIQHVDMFASDEKSIGLVILFILLGLLAIAAVIWMIIAMSVHGSNESGKASAGSSESNSNSDSGGSGSGSCYVATMVYGSYDAPEVMVLRQFRDNFLQKFYFGRLFIQIYYKYSPHFVARFRHNQTIHKPIRFLLNGFVYLLDKK
ncbi:MAG: CFI-box-CTERM domain-containing protein [Flavobacteriales bacterium]